MRRKYDAPVFVDDDVNARALGEPLFGAGRGASHMLYVLAHWGLGGALVMDVYGAGSTEAPSRSDRAHGDKGGWAALRRRRVRLPADLRREDGDRPSCPSRPEASGHDRLAEVQTETVTDRHVVEA